PEAMVTYVEDYETNIELARESFVKARDYTGGNPSRLADLERIDSLLVAYDDSLQSLITGYEETGAFDTEIVDELNVRGAEYKSAVDTTIASLQESLAASHSSYADRSNSARQLLIGGLVVAVAVAVIAGVVVVRSITRPLRKTVGVLQQVADG